jgi:hypothetical protein
MVMSSKSTSPPGANKSNNGEKPRPDFPLWPHAMRRWAKEIEGRMHYSGPWDAPDGGLQKHLDQEADLDARCKPRPTGEGLTVWVRQTAS